jgi:hypothetical protein
MPAHLGKGHLQPLPEADARSKLASWRCRRITCGFIGCRACTPTSFESSGARSRSLPRTARFRNACARVSARPSWSGAAPAVQPREPAPGALVARQSSRHALAEDEYPVRDVGWLKRRSAGHGAAAPWSSSLPGKSSIPAFTRQHGPRVGIAWRSGWPKAHNPVMQVEHDPSRPADHDEDQNSCE